MSRGADTCVKALASHHAPNKRGARRVPLKVFRALCERLGSLGFVVVLGVAMMAAVMRVAAMVRTAVGMAGGG